MNHDSKRTYLHIPDNVGEVAAGIVARTLGSWRFVLAQTAVIILWISTGGFGHDPMPYLLMNVCLSLQAAYAAPILQLSSNRQARIDRKRDDLEADEVAADHVLLQQNTQITKDMQTLLEQNIRLTTEVHALTTKIDAHIAGTAEQPLDPR